MAEHPRVSEEHEGKPAFEWAVAILVVGFDSFIGIALGVGLLATYFSIGMLIG